MDALPLPDELLLLGYDDAAGIPLVSAATLDLGLAGAVLVELALAGRVTVTDGTVTALSGAAVGDPVTDGAVAVIAADNKRRNAQHWVGKLAGSVREPVLERLVADGVVERDETKVLGLFRRVRYPALNPAPETAAHSKLDGLVRLGEVPDPHTAALASLVHATGLGPHLFPDLPAREVKARLGAEGDWAATAVRAAVAAIQAGVIAATTAATTAATAATTFGGT